MNSRRSTTKSVQTFIAVMATILGVPLALLVTFRLLRERPLEETLRLVGGFSAFIYILGCLGAASGALEQKLCAIRLQGGQASILLQVAEAMAWCVVALWFALRATGWWIASDAFVIRIAFLFAMIASCAFIYTVRSAAANE